MPGSNGRSIQDRAGDTVVDSQDGFWDKEITDNSLEALLDEREVRKEEKAAANRRFKEKDDLAKARLSEFSLSVGEVARVGKYRLEVKRRDGGHREFDVPSGERLTIRLFE